MKEYLDEKLHEECGVFGMYDRDGHDVVATAYYALYALQHRGQESCGIAVNDGGVIYKRRELDLPFRRSIRAECSAGICHIFQNSVLGLSISWKYLFVFLHHMKIIWN